jgi:hypothetical protein
MKNLITKKLALLAMVLFASIGSAFGQSIDVTLTGVDNSGDLCADVSLMSNSMSDPRWTSGHNQFSFSEGEDVTMKVYVYNSLYSIKSILIDDVDLTNEIINNGNSYTFSSLSGNHTVNIVFDKKPTQNVQVTINHSDAINLSFSGDGYWYSTSESETVEVPDGKSIWMSFSYLSSAYPIKSVVIDGNNVTDQFLADKGYSFQNISGAHSVNIELDELQSHTISFIRPDESFWPNVYFVDGNYYINGYDVVLAAGHTVKMFITLPAGYQINTVNVKDSQEHTLDVNTVTNSILTNGYYEFTELSDNYVVTITYQTVDKYTITTNFDDEKGWVNYMINGNASGVSPNNPIAFNKGTTVRYIAGVHSDYYKVKSFLVDGVDKTSEYLLNNYYEFSNLNANHAVEVQYRESAPVTISYTFNREDLFGLGIIWDNGSMSLSNSQSIELPEGSFVRLYFSWIDEAYKIKAIKVDGVDVVTETFMTDGYLLSNVTSDHSVDIQIETIQPSYAMNVTFNHDGFGDVCFDDSHYNRCVNYAQTVDVAAGEDIWVYVNLFSSAHPLKSIKVDDTDVTNDVKQNGGYSIPNISSNHSVYVEFDELPSNTISVSWQEGNAEVYFEDGNITMWGQEAQIVSGHNAKMFITPTAGYAISNVSISDGSSTQDITDTFNANGGYYEFTSVNVDYTVTVQFTEVETRTITLSFDNEKGSVYINGRWAGPYEFTYNLGSTIRLTTNPRGGYKVGSIFVDEEEVTNFYNTNGYYEFVLNSNSAITVNFVEATYYTVSVSCDNPENGYYSLNQEGDVIEGADIYLSVNPYTGYVPIVTDNGAVVVLTQEHGSYYYEINDLDADHTINVRFDEAETSNIYLSINENETVVSLNNNSRTNSGYFKLTTGITARLVVDPQIGYELESIIIDNDDVTDDYKANGYYDLVVKECIISVTMKKKVAPETVPFILSDLGIGTFCYEFDLDFSNVRGIKAYVASGFNPISKQLVLTKVDEVPAGTGILIKGSSGDYQIPTTDTYFCYANMLKGVVKDTYIPENSWEEEWNGYGLYAHYLLGDDGEFYRTNGEDLPANSAYLTIPTKYVDSSSLAKIGLIFVDDEEEVGGITTGVGYIWAGENRTVTTDAIYNLQGQKITEKSLKPGIYIKNGKKFMVK